MRLATVEKLCLLGGAGLLFAVAVMHGALPVLGMFAAGVTLIGLAYYCEAVAQRRAKRHIGSHAVLTRDGLASWPQLHVRHADPKDVLN
jgi:hypothetical protein